MSTIAKEVNLPAIFKHMEYLERAQVRLYDLAGILDEQPEALPLLDTALESISGQSSGSNAFDKVSRAVEVIREAIVRLFKALFYAIKDLVVNYRNRLERLHDEVNAVQDEVDAMTKSGALQGERSGSFDHLPIANALYKAPRVNQRHLKGELGSFTNYIKLIQDVTKSRALNNQRLLSSLPKVKGVSELRDLLVAHAGSSVTNQNANAKQLSQIHLKDGQQLKVSSALLGNKVIGFIDYKPEARLRDFIDTTQDGRMIPWAASSHGYRLLDADPDFRIRDQGNAVFAILTANEIRTLLPQIRSRLSNLKLVVNAVDDVASTLRKTEHQAARLPITHLDTASQRVVKDYFLTGTREDLRFSVDLTQHLFSVLMYSLLWVRISLKRYSR